jgi:hypothetical protein
MSSWYQISAELLTAPITISALMQFGTTQNLIYLLSALGQNAKSDNTRAISAVHQFADKN